MSLSGNITFARNKKFFFIKDYFHRHLHCRNKAPTLSGKKTGHKINRVKLLVGGSFSHFHIKLVTFPQPNFRF